MCDEAVTSMHSENWQTGFDDQFFLLLAVWPQSSNLTTLSLSFPSHKLRMKQMIQLCSGRFCKKQMPRWDVYEGNSCESVGRGCRRLEMLWNLQADWIPAKKKKRERGKKEKTSDCRATLRKFWQSFKEFLSPHQLWGITHHPGKSLSLYPNALGHWRQQLVQSEVSAQYRDGFRVQWRGPSANSTPSSKSSTSSSPSEPYTNLKR